MGQIFNLMISLVFYLIIMISRSAGGGLPLIFDPFTLEIYDIEDTIESPYAVAYISFEQFHQDFDKRYSLDNVALSIEFFFKKGESASDFIWNEFVDLAMVYHFENKVRFIEFGYEIYYVKTDYNENFNTASYSDFKKIKKPGFTVAQAVSSLNWPTKPTIARQDVQMPSSGRSYRTIYKPVEFIWLSRVKFQFDHYAWTVTTVSYKVDKKTYKFNENCKDYSSGEHMYPKPHNVDDFYTEANQKDIFSVVQVPASSSENCQELHQCVKKYSLASPYFFQRSGSMPLVCSNLTTIPIWYDSTEKLLNYVEKFISVIALVTNYNVYVTDGTLDTVTLPLKDGGEPHPMYMFADEMRIPIPKIIYKIVTYKSYDCDHPERKLCWFGVVIVIHNEPESSDWQTICATDQCKNFGWQSIQFASTDKNAKRKSTNIYCCKYEGPVLEKLASKKDEGVRGDLNLKKFPYYDGKLHRIEFEDRQAEFENKMKELFPEYE